MIRTFIAVEMPEAIRTRVASEVNRLKAEAPLVKWVRPENLHLTLRFLGDVKETDLEELFEAVAAAVAETSSFPLEVRSVGAFPHWRHPRVVWAGCGDGAEEASRLAAAVEEACVSLGYERERRPFRPHLTLGRVKLPADADGLDVVVAAAEDEDFGCFDVDEVAVFMSSLRRTGPVYSPMARFGLRP